MLRITNMKNNKNILSFTVFIEDEKSYKMSVYTDTDMFSVCSSDIPQSDKIYERQARTALLRYKKEKEFPKEIVSLFY